MVNGGVGCDMKSSERKSSSGGGMSSFDMKSSVDCSVGDDVSTSTGGPVGDAVTGLDVIACRLAIFSTSDCAARSVMTVVVTSLSLVPHDRPSTTSFLLFGLIQVYVPVPKAPAHSASEHPVARLLVQVCAPYHCPAENPCVPIMLVMSVSLLVMTNVYLKQSSHRYCFCQMEVVVCVTVVMMKRNDDCIVTMMIPG